jgi:predicted DNA-binding transcriptional regulator
LITIEDTLDIKDNLIEAELKGKTLLVYMYLLRSESQTVGVREVQRALRFSSPSVAFYHLNKLEDLGLIKNEHGDYILKKEVKVGILKLFINLGGVMLPRYLFYAVLMTSMIVTYFIQFSIVITPDNISLMLMVFVLTIILWFETFKIWREKPT